MLKTLVKDPTIIKFAGFVADELPPNNRFPQVRKAFSILESLVDN